MQLASFGAIATKNDPLIEIPWACNIAKWSSQAI